ncbi:MAG: hypothetical protein ACKN9W_00755, partial [Methylococcus sp.]
MTHPPTGAGSRRGMTPSLPASLLGTLALLLVSSMALASSVNYNLTNYTTGISSRVTLPPAWTPASSSIDYGGSLDVYWSLQIDSNSETLEVSKANAV